MTERTNAAKLGAVVRQRREAAGLSMEALAQHAGVSRSMLHRLEHGPATKAGRQQGPMPSKLARILVVLGVEPSEVQGLLGEDAVSEVLYWMTNAEDVRAYAEARQVGPRSGQPDLVLLHADGTVCALEVRSHGAQGAMRIDELARAARALGYMVTVPAEDPSGT